MPYNRFFLARGFGSRWIKWISDILNSSSSQILMNGHLGEKIISKCGLRHGDALSPYLFILVADVLQQICDKEYRAGSLKHPLGVDGPFPVLQYADDMLLLVQGDIQQVRTVKRILDTFSSYTGLTINFQKSSFVPICLDQPTCQQIAHILQCQTAPLPCTYLG